MQARVKWVEGLTFLGESASGHQILMDGNSGDKAPSPMEIEISRDIDAVTLFHGHRIRLRQQLARITCGRAVHSTEDRKSVV